MEIIVKTKKWGNSMGVVLPAELVKEEELKMGEELVVEVKKKSSVLKELFGALDFGQPTEKLLKELRKDMESKWLQRSA